METAVKAKKVTDEVVGEYVAARMKDGHNVTDTLVETAVKAKRCALPSERCRDNNLDMGFALWHK